MPALLLQRKKCQHQDKAILTINYFWTPTYHEQQEKHLSGNIPHTENTTATRPNLKKNNIGGVFFHLFNKNVTIL